MALGLGNHKGSTHRQRREDLNSKEKQSEYICTYMLEDGLGQSMQCVPYL